MKEDNKILTILLLLLACATASLCWVIANITYVELETPWTILIPLCLSVFCCGFGIGRYFGDN